VFAISKIISILIVFFAISLTTQYFPLQVYGEHVIEQFSETRDRYCEPADSCTFVFDHVSGKPFTVNIKVNDNKPVSLTIVSNTAGGGWDNHEDNTVFTGEFAKTYDTIYDEVMIHFGRSAELKSGIDLELFYSGYTYAEHESGGGCLIATATFGTELAPEVQKLREIRDNTLLQTESGTSFMQGFNQFYYSFSPTIADYERQNPIFKETVKIAITPLITSLSLLNYVDMDSEIEVLGYGFSLILINIGMYFVAPAIVINRVRKFV